MAHLPSTTRGPIFLVGCPRSGTTLLQQMLNAHPAIAIAPETHFIRRFWLQRERYGDLSEDENYQRLIREMTMMPEFTEMQLNAREFSEAAWENGRSYPALFQLLLEQFARTHHTHVVGERTPEHLLYMPILRQFFPAARFIHLVRDPRAVVNSWRQVPWSSGNPIDNAKVWRLCVVTARKSPPDIQASLLTLQYEQLVNAPDRSLRTVCEFLGVMFESSMLEYANNGPRFINVAREPWKTAATQRLNHAALTRWTTELSRDVITDIEVAVWVEMRRFGYRAQTPGWLLVPAVAAAELRRKWTEFQERAR